MWAPNAGKVSVIGSFNEGIETPMAPEGEGYWSVKVSNAAEGDEYEFAITRGKEKLWRNDPYAKGVTSSVGNAIIQGTKFDWSDESYLPPALNQMVMHELHLGT